MSNTSKYQSKTKIPQSATAITMSWFSTRIPSINRIRRPIRSVKRILRQDLVCQQDLVKRILRLDLVGQHDLVGQKVSVPGFCRLTGFDARIWSVDRMGSQDSVGKTGRQDSVSRLRDPFRKQQWNTPTFNRQRGTQCTGTYSTGKSQSPIRNGVCTASSTPSQFAHMVPEKDGLTSSKAPNTSNSRSKPQSIIAMIDDIVLLIDYRY